MSRIAERAEQQILAYLNDLTELISDLEGERDDLRKEVIRLEEKISSLEEGGDE